MRFAHHSPPPTGQSEDSQLWPEMSWLKGRTGYSGQKGREAPLFCGNLRAGWTQAAARLEDEEKADCSKDRGGREWPCGWPALHPWLQHLCGWVKSLHECA